jgi:hypothetical protein
MACQEASDPFKIIWLAPSFCWDFIDNILGKNVVLDKALSHARCNPSEEGMSDVSLRKLWKGAGVCLPWKQSIDLNIVWPQLVCKRVCELSNGSFGWSIDGKSRHRLVRCQ